MAAAPVRNNAIRIRRTTFTSMMLMVILRRQSAPPTPPRSGIPISVNRIVTLVDNSVHGSFWVTDLGSKLRLTSTIRFTNVGVLGVAVVAG